MEDLLVPRSLIGSHPAVKRRWQRTMEAVWEKGAIAGCVPPEDFVPLSEVTGELLLDRPVQVGEGTPLRLYLVLECMPKPWGTMPEAEVCARTRRLVLEGLDEFWFALAVLPECPLAGFCTELDPKAADYSAMAMEKLLRWWPQLCELDGRFTCGLGWPAGWRSVRGWGLRALGWCSNAGMEDEMLPRLLGSDPKVAGAKIAEFLRGRNPLHA